MHPCVSLSKYPSFLSSFLPFFLSSFLSFIRLLSALRLTSVCSREFRIVPFSSKPWRPSLSSVRKYRSSPPWRCLSGGTPFQPFYAHCSPLRLGLMASKATWFGAWKSCILALSWGNSTVRMQRQQRQQQPAPRLRLDSGHRHMDRRWSALETCRGSHSVEKYC